MHENFRPKKDLYTLSIELPFIINPRNLIDLRVVSIYFIRIRLQYITRPSSQNLLDLGEVNYTL